MNYEEMSDFEINKAMLERIYGKEKVFADTIKERFLCVVDEKGMRTPDYCNNWADMGPLIIEMVLDGRFIGIEGDQVTIDMDHELCDEGKQLRALAICWLRVMDAKEEQK